MVADWVKARPYGELPDFGKRWCKLRPKCHKVFIHSDIQMLALELESLGALASVVPAADLRLPLECALEHATIYSTLGSCIHAFWALAGYAGELDDGKLRTLLEDFKSALNLCDQWFESKVLSLPAEEKEKILESGGIASQSTLVKLTSLKEFVWPATRTQLIKAWTGILEAPLAELGASFINSDIKGELDKVTKGETPDMEVLKTIRRSDQGRALFKAFKDFREAKETGFLQSFQFLVTWIGTSF